MGVTAVTKADLVSTLQRPGPYTVLAPTDAAFAKIDTAALNALLNDPDRLRSTLLGHVISGKVLSSDLNNGQLVDTLSGRQLRVQMNSDGSVQFKYAETDELAATVGRADILASNGVVHAIDTVLMGPSSGTSTPSTPSSTSSTSIPKDK